MISSMSEQSAMNSSFFKDEPIKPSLRFAYSLVLLATTLVLSTVLLAGDYEIEVMFNDTGCTASTFIPVVELDSCVILQGISPNGDQWNQKFDLSSYDVQSLEIFNRNGTLVYSKTNYKDEWEGQTNDGDNLPVGTYFYVMKYQGNKVRTAWVYINK